MMNITYGIIKEVYYIGTISRISYGIAAYANTAENGTDNVVSSVHDITADEKALAEFVLLCNRLELALIHLNDVIDDFLVT